MKQNDVFQMSNGYSEFPSYVERSSSRPRLLLIFIIVLLLILAALAAFYFIGLNSNKELVQSIPTVPTPTSGQSLPLPTATPAVSQTPPERSELTVAILNGSGTAGAARGVSSTLNSLGYTIGTIGNADNFTYQGLTIHVKQSKSAYLSLLQDDLKKANPNASIAASVDNTIDNDAEVIVGR